MTELLEVLLKNVGSLKLNLRQLFSKSSKEPIQVFHTPPTLLHEELIEVISSVRVDEIADLFSLDTRQSPKLACGNNVIEAIENIENLKNLIRKRVTVTRQQVLSLRIPYKDSGFFIDNQGYYIDRKEGFKALLGVYLEYANTIQRTHAELTKDGVTRHNLRLSEVILKDMLEFVKGIVYEH